MRRIPFWFVVAAPVLAETGDGAHAAGRLQRHDARARRRGSRRYRYPTGGDVTYPGPERRLPRQDRRAGRELRRRRADRHAVPHVVFAGDENHLAGYPGLPIDLNPYGRTFGEARPVAGAVLPAPGVYDIVFDTRSAALAGPFTFRYWVNDMTPPTLRVVPATRGRSPSR